MALINNIYILVEKESVDNDVETVSHPTESGMDVSDTIRKKPITIDLIGVIAHTEKLTAETAISKIKTLQNNGSLITYVGQAGTFTNLQIQSFHTDFTNKNYGGASFDMSLKEIKTAKVAYYKVATTSTSASASSSKTETKPKPITTTKAVPSVDDIVIFSGGAVYLSSDARVMAIKREKSTCRLTKDVSNRGAKHPYHLISIDGGKVYGWVDKDKVTLRSTTISSSSNGGKQQVQEDANKIIYHQVKKGETIFTLVYSTYKGKNKGKNFSVSKTVEYNPQAFSVNGWAPSLKIGARLRMY